MIYASLFQQPWFVIVMLLLIFGFIVVLVMLLKKYVPIFQNKEKPKSKDEIVKEDLDRVLEDMVVEEESSSEDNLEEVAKDLEKETRDPERPTEEEALQDQMDRSVEEIDDPEVLKAMEEYAKEHPEEAEVAAQDEDE